MPANITKAPGSSNLAVSACKATARNSTVAFRRSPKSSSDCLRDALAVLSPEGVDAYLDHARALLGRMGRGVEPVLAFLEEWPSIAAILGEEALPAITRTMQRSGNRRMARRFSPSCRRLPPSRRLPARQQMQHYLDLTLDLMERTSGSIHGIHKTFASPACPSSSARHRRLLNSTEYRRTEQLGRIRHPQLPQPSRTTARLLQPAVGGQPRRLQRERHGTLLVDHERLLDLYLRGAMGRQRAPGALCDKPDNRRDTACPTTTLLESACRTSSTMRMASPASTATARCWRTSPAIGAGAARCSPTTSARCSAWRSRSSKTAASKR
jgi:hypothetical protein